MKVASENCIVYGALGERIFNCKVFYRPTIGGCRCENDAINNDMDTDGNVDVDIDTEMILKMGMIIRTMLSTMIWTLMAMLRFALTLTMVMQLMMKHKASSTRKMFFKDILCSLGMFYESI